MVMTRRGMMKTIDTASIEHAIGEAEKRTSGEICVSVSPYFWGNVRKVAEKAFDRLGMTKTANRNGVLIFLVPSRKKFVVMGDSGIHAKVGDQFWSSIATAMSEKFHNNDFTGGLISGIESIGEQLATHFPYDAETDRNELSNALDL